MKRTGYKILLELLKFLVQIKRGVVVAGKWLGGRFGKTLAKSARILFFGTYKRYVGIQRKLEGRFSNTEEKIYALSSNTIFSSVLIAIIVVTVVFPHTRFATPEVYGAGNELVLFEILDPGEEASYAQDEIIIETAETGVPIDRTEVDPFALSVKAEFETTASQDHDANIEELVGVWAGGGAISGPLIMPGAEVTPSRRKTETYIVQQGDSVGRIADKFGISVNTLLWENNLSAKSFIRPGDVLSILPVTGVSHVVKRGETLSKIANTYDIDTVDELVEYNRLSAANDIRVGEKLIIPGGEKRVVRKVVKTKTYAPKNYQNVAPPPPSRYANGQGMVWPTTGRVITQYYHARHHALDIDGHYQDPIYASDAGTVIVAGWRGGYGLSIDVDHGNGIITRYAHASKMFVSVGDRVTKGEVMAMVGTTGYSTGTHLHYEIIVNGVKVNPFSYVR